MVRGRDVKASGFITGRLYRFRNHKTFNVNREWIGPLFGVTLALAFLLSATLFGGCRGNLSRRDLEEIDTLFRRCDSDFERCGLFGPDFKNLDLHDTGFAEKTLEEIEKSEEACKAFSASIEKLRSVCIESGTSTIVMDILDYCDRASVVASELVGVFEGLRVILGAVEPVMEIEKEVPGLGGQETYAIALQRLTALEEATRTALQVLPALDVPQALAEYKDFFIQLMQCMHDNAVANITILRKGSFGNGVGNERYQRLQSLAARYPQIVEKLSDTLEVEELENMAADIELEINHLFLEGGK